MNLEDRLRRVMQFKQMSVRSEDAYVMWLRQFVNFHGERNPEDLGAVEVSAFLSHLVTEKGVATATQNQALHALVFLYREVLRRELEGVVAMRAKKGERLPVVLSVDEVKRLLRVLDGEEGLMVRLLYGCGLRLMECLQLRVKDVDLAEGKLMVRDGKGDKDRVVNLPVKVRELVAAQLEKCRVLYEQDKVVAGEFDNFWFFPGDGFSKDAVSGALQRVRKHESRVGRALVKAAKSAGVERRVTAQTLRHSFATHLVLRGVDIKSVQDLLGHSDVRTTEIYTKLAKAMRGEIVSPLDEM